MEDIKEKTADEMEIECKGDWDLLKKILEEAPKESEYITYKGEKWIKEDYCIPISVIQNKIDEVKHRKSKDEFEFACKLKGILYLQELLEERR
jgi:hypothetical protein